MKICFLERKEIKTFNGNRQPGRHIGRNDLRHDSKARNNLAVTLLRKRYNIIILANQRFLRPLGMKKIIPKLECLRDYKKPFRDMT